jgi:hypothetical protein
MCVLFTVAGIVWSPTGPHGSEIHDGRSPPHGAAPLNARPSGPRTTGYSARDGSPVR